MKDKPIPLKPEVLNIPDFWACMSKSEKRFLALDYDGTLAPFRIDRMEAYPLPGIVDSLKSINEAGKTILAIVSGRPLSEVMSFIGGLNITFVGSHGFELKHPDNGIVFMSPDDEQSEGLKAARRIALELNLGELIETKAACVALHTRAMEASRAERVEEQIYNLWASIAPRYNLHCRHFNGGIEILARGWNKGNAVLSLIAEASADFSVYIGDDTTDEDVFKSLSGFGTGIRVGDPEQRTMADGFLADCWMVKEFLVTWLSVDSGEAG